MQCTHWHTAAPAFLVSTAPLLTTSLIEPGYLLAFFSSNTDKGFRCKALYSSRPGVGFVSSRRASQLSTAQQHGYPTVCSNCRVSCNLIRCSQPDGMSLLMAHTSALHANTTQLIDTGRFFKSAGSLQSRAQLKASIPASYQRFQTALDTLTEQIVSLRNINP